MFLIPILTSAAFAGEECRFAVPASELVRLAGEVDAAFQEADITGVVASAVVQEEFIPCLKERISPQVAARFHLTQGLAHFVGKKQDLAAEELERARTVAPELQFSPSLMGDHHPLRKLHEGFSTAPAEVRPVDGLVAGWLVIDGERTRDVPVGLPFIAQQFDDAGRLLASSLVRPGHPLELVAAEKPRKRTSRGLLVAGMGIAVVGGGSLAVSQVIRAQHVKVGTDDVEAWRKSYAQRSGPYTALAVSGYGLLAVGGALSAAAVVKGKW